MTGLPFPRDDRPTQRMEVFADDEKVAEFYRPLGMAYHDETINLAYAAAREVGVDTSVKRITIGGIEERDLQTLGALDQRHQEIYHESKRAWREEVARELGLEQEQPVAGVAQRRVEETVGRNDPCPCGSGSKFKRCCQGA